MPQPNGFAAQIHGAEWLLHGMAMKLGLKRTQQKPEQKLAMNNSAPLPLCDQPMSHALRVRRNVLLVPWGSNEPSGARRAAGLFDTSGKHIPSGDCLRYDDDPLTIVPEYDRAAPVETLKGRYIYGGMAYSHFGHFLCESTGRLWALDHLKDIDGVIWLPKARLGHSAKQVRHYNNFFEALGRPDLKLISPQVNTRIEELVIPEQGFGIGEMSAGRPEYRDFMRKNLGHDIPPKGPRRLYISRAQLNTKRGSVLLENRIEAMMRASGYRIMHPEGRKLGSQICRYKNVESIVALDGSALHLAAMVMRPDAKVAIINRGPSQNIDDYIRQFQAFAGITPTRIEAIKSYWFEAGRRVVKRETHALLDFPAVGAALVAAGFIKDATAWTAADPDEITAEITRRESAAEITLQRYEM